MKFDQLEIFVISISICIKHLGSILYVSNWVESIDDHIRKVSVQFGTYVLGTCY